MQLIQNLELCTFNIPKILQGWLQSNHGVSSTLLRVGQMADPLSAISLAGNLIQFVDSGIKIISLFREISANADGASKDNLISEAIIKDLQAQVQDLKGSDWTSLDWSTQALVQECQDVTTDLGHLFIALRPKSNSKLDRVRATGMAVQKRQKIKSLEAHLFKIRDQIVSRLIGHIFVQRQQLSAIFSSFVGADDVWKMETETKLNKALLHLDHLLRHHADQGASEDLAHITQKLRETLAHIHTAHKTQAILQSLHFQQIKQRESDILEAHQSTFTWALQNYGDFSFIKWLSSQAPDLDMFWVAGKAGCGKSTLMKLVSRHDFTLRCLGQWSGAKRLLIASHFFWSLGVHFQRTQEGLLRTLLFQILMKVPSLIPIVCRSRYEATTFEHLESWSRSELFETLETLAQLPDIPVKVCIFIDGLDEYKGDHLELISILKTLNQAPDIKICVSSRPWVDFLDAFDQGPWKLYVQDLTYNDIRLYIRDHFENNSRFIELRGTYPTEATGLMTEVADKAQGVFLWVYLVVRELLRGLRNRDSIADLQRRLGSIPPDLEPYFKMMLDSIDKVYHQRTAKVFRILLHSRLTLPVLTFYFVDQEEVDPRYALRTDTLPGSDSQIRNLIQQKKLQLIAQCKDLLHLSTASKDPLMLQERAGFLHRTVADFLQSNGIDDLIDKMLPPRFDPRVSLCRAFLAEIKGQWPIMRYSPSQSIRVKEHVAHLVLGIVYYAYENEILENRDQLVLFEELENVVFEDFVFRSTYPVMIGSVRTRSLLEISSLCGLDHYVMKRVDDPGVDKAEILRNALKRGFVITDDADFKAYAKQEFDIKLLKKLIDHGISPNSPLPPVEEGNTVWKDYVVSLPVRKDARDATRREWNFEICSLMLSNGADKAVKVGGHDLMTAFNAVFELEEAMELRVLLELQQTSTEPQVTSTDARLSSGLQRLSLWGAIWDSNLS